MKYGVSDALYCTSVFKRYVIVFRLFLFSRLLIHCFVFSTGPKYPYSNVLSTKTYHVIYFLKRDADTKRIVVRYSKTTSHSIRPMNHMYSSVHPLGEYMTDSGRW